MNKISAVNFLLVLLLLFNLIAACQDNREHKKVTGPNIDSVEVKKDGIALHKFKNNASFKSDSATVACFFKNYPLLHPLEKEVTAFYYKRLYGFIWFDGSGLTAQAQNLYKHIENINSEGLPDKTLYKTELTTFLRSQGKDSAGNPSSYTELMLTAQYFIYAKNVWVGLDQKERKNIKWYLPANKLSPAQWLDSLNTRKNLFDSPPLYRQYSLLKDFLEKYQHTYTKNDFPFIVANKRIYQKGDSSSVIVAVRKWLFIAGDLSADNNSNFFDDSLEAAVKNFQQRFGLKDNGFIDAGFIRQMNVPVNTRMQQIKVNMERSRWIPVNTISNYLVINIPEFKLHMYENNDLIWSMNVVVGKPAHATVIFNGDIKYIVFSPYWNVPPGILRKEVLPGMHRIKDYLAEHDMEWNAGNVRQKPGPDNSLGLVKFLFPNSYNIYLHDTPVKSLFGETSRAFSHGCIRLEDARKLAIYLLRTDEIWTLAKIDSALHKGKEQTLTLKNSEPVFIAYFTAWVDRKGRLNFRKDEYRRDKPLASLLLHKAVL